MIFVTDGIIIFLILRNLQKEQGLWGQHTRVEYRLCYVLCIKPGQNIFSSVKKE